MKQLYILLVMIAVMSVIAGCGSVSVRDDFVIPQEATAIDQSLYHMFFANEEIPFLGLIDHSEAATSSLGGMAYPGYSAGVFLAGILTHAVVQGAVNRGREDARQKAANIVLEKYDEVIRELSPATLFPMPVELGELETVLVVRGADSPDGLMNSCRVSVDPAFFMTQNQESLILVNYVELIYPLFGPSVDGKEKGRHTRKRNRKPAAVGGTKVEYVYSPEIPLEPEYYWSEEGYKRLIDATQNMFLETIKLAFVRQRTENVPPPSTVRYIENGVKKVERGSVVGSSAERITFITLSGGIKSVPRMIVDIPAGGPVKL